MKIKRRKAAENQLITKHGSCRFYQLVRGKSEWRDARVPEYKPNWHVRFHVGGETWEESAGGLYPVAEGLAAVKVWAETLMRTRLEAMRQGKLNEMEAVVRVAEAVMLSDLRRVFLQNVPPRKADYRKNIARLCAILTEATGLDEERIPVTEALWGRGLLLGWVRMRQEHFRRGWSLRGAAPVNAWQILREELKAGRLPGIDKETVMECNTTIQTYLRCAKAVFANQREYLVGLKLPELREFLSFTVDVAAVQGHREMGEEILARIVAEMPVLRREEPRVFALLQAVAWLAGRPGTVKMLRGDALRVLEDGTGVIAQPPVKRGLPIATPVSAGCVEALLAVRTEESLIGARHKTEAQTLHNELNEWLTRLGVTGTKKASVFRHMKLNILRNEYGAEVAAAAAGHTTTMMVKTRYTQNEAKVPMVDPWARKVG